MKQYIIVSTKIYNKHKFKYKSNIYYYLFHNRIYQIPQFFTKAATSISTSHCPAAETSYEVFLTAPHISNERTKSNLFPFEFKL